ncbi:MAG: ATP-binding protein [Anaeromyxobacteraceae bacterium]
MNLFGSLFRRLDASMRARILAPTAILFAITLAAMVTGAVIVYSKDMDRSRRERAELFANMVAGGISNVMLSGQPGEVPGLLGTLISHRNDLVVASLLGPTGVVSASTDPGMLGKHPWPAPQKMEGTTVLPAPGGDDTVFAVLQPIANLPACARCHGSAATNNGWLDLRFTREPVLDSEMRLARTLTFSAGAAFIALLVILLWLLGREAVTPLQRLVAAMHRAESGDLGVRADEGRPDELGDAARSFDAMLASLRRSQAELEAFYRERMVRADRFAAVGEIATGLAHEIKNPLAGLSGALELMAEDLAQNPRHSEMVGEMRHQVQRLSNTMESLLSFARPPKARLRASDVNVSLEKVLFLIRQQCRDGCVAIIPDLGAGLPAVLADPAQLEQVFLNLCLNACQAMQRSEGSRLIVRSRKGEGTVHVEIEDSGPGIPAEARANVFKPFYTTKGQGNGLGLAISARIVSEHGGHIGYRCPPDGGTIFTVTLQQARASGSRAAEHAA